MSKLLIRIIAVLLINGLVSDALMPAGAATFEKQERMISRDFLPFSEQALAVDVQNVHRPLVSDWRIRAIEASAFRKVNANVAVAVAGAILLIAAGLYHIGTWHSRHIGNPSAVSVNLDVEKDYPRTGELFKTHKEGEFPEDLHLWYQFGLATTKTSPLDVQRLFQNFDGLIQKDSEVRGVLTEMAEDQFAYLALRSFFSEQGSDQVSGASGRFYSDPARRRGEYIAMTPPFINLGQLIDVGTGSHELVHYILNKNNALIDGERKHDIVAVMGERSEWVSMIRKGDLAVLIRQAERLSNRDLAQGLLNKNDDQFLPKADLKFFIENVRKKEFIAAIVQTYCTPDLANANALSPAEQRDFRHLTAYSADILQGAFLLAAEQAQSSGQPIHQVVKGTLFQTRFEAFLKDFAQRMEANPQRSLRQASEQARQGMGPQAFYSAAESAASLSNWNQMSAGFDGGGSWFDILSKALMSLLLAMGIKNYSSKRHISIDAGQVPSKYPSYITQRNLKRLAFFSHTNLLMYAALFSIIRAFGYGHLIGTLGFLGFYGLMQFATKESTFSSLVENITEPTKLLRLAEKEITLLGARPEDLKIKAIGYKWSWKRMRHEYVLWLDEPDFLIWAGLVAPIAIYMKPAQDWVKAHKRILAWGQRLLDYHPLTPAPIPGKEYRLLYFAV